MENGSNTLQALKQSLPAGKAPAGGANVGDVDRYASFLGAGLLAALAARRGPAGASLLAIAAGYLAYRGATGHCYLYDAAGINTREAVHTPAENVVLKGGIKIEKAVTINKDAQTLFDYWRNFENLPKFMQHLKAVKIFDSTHSHWIARAPAGTRAEWDAEVINEISGKLIAWKSLDHATVANAGSVHFDAAPGGRGTEVRVVLQYEPPAGRLGAMVARVFGEEPGMQVEQDLRRFKQLMEAGEISTAEGQPHG